MTHVHNNVARVSHSIQSGTITTRIQSRNRRNVTVRPPSCRVQNNVRYSLTFLDLIVAEAPPPMTHRSPSADAARRHYRTPPVARHAQLQFDQPTPPPIPGPESSTQS